MFIFQRVTSTSNGAQLKELMTGCCNKESSPCEPSRLLIIPVAKVILCLFFLLSVSIKVPEGYQYNEKENTSSRNMYIKGDNTQYNGAGA